MTDFVPSPHLIVLAQHGDYRLTKAEHHEDYNVWYRDTIKCWGGKKLATETFERIKEREMTTPTQAPAPTINIEKRIDQYVKLRDTIKEADDAHKEKMKGHREALEKLNNLLLQHMLTVGGDSVKTGAGTVYKTVKKSASLEDADAFMRHVITKEAWELIERKASVTAVEAFVAENGVLPPGVKFSQMPVVGVRRA